MFQFDEETLDTKSQNTQSNNRLIHLSCDAVQKMYEKYEDDLYMTSKIHHYISQQLPTLLENIKHNREKNIQRNEDHSAEQERFILSFLEQNRYYYYNANETYYYYDGTTYKTKTEDEILHHIVSSISENRNPMLMNWKHKTKVSILKKIKERNILKSIPDSITIQTVLEHLRPIVCTTKTESKYFLSIIGDNILKKHPTRIHYLTPLMKNYIKCLNNICVNLWNNQCAQTFKFKYHEKHLENLEECRLVPSAQIMPKVSWYESFLQKKGLDILCVAIHYSHKYGSSDEYISEGLTEPELQTYIFSLKQREPKELLNDFIKEYLVDYENSSDTESLSVSASPQDEFFLQKHTSTKEANNKSLSSTEIQYLWKLFLKNLRYPSNLYQNVYKKILVENFLFSKYNSDLDIFENVGSSQIPLIKKFLKFWEETIIEDTRIFSELEIEEIATLFRKWLNPMKSVNGKRQKYFLTESKLLDVLSYFHPELEIGDNKYVYNVRSLIWDKDLDIENAISTYKENHTETISILTYLDEAYTFYCSFQTMGTSQEERPNKNFLVSKSYFEKYIRSKES